MGDIERDGLAASSAIVVVDEDNTFLELMDFCLSTHSYRTIRCPRYELAYGTIMVTKPALVMIDLQYGRSGDGWKLLQQLHQDPETVGIPTLVCSIDREFLTRVSDELDLMATAMLAKPFRVTDLLLMVERQMGPSQQHYVPSSN